MKKFLALAVCLLAGTMLFAETYTVKSVTGKATYAESEKGKFKPVSAGMTVSDETFLSISTDSKVVLTMEDGKEITLRTPKKASVAELIEAKMSIAGSAKKGKGTATAASRASQVMAEGELDD